MSRRGAKVIYIWIFRNSLLNIRTSTYGICVAECLFLLSEVSGCAHVTWCWHKRSQRERKLTRNFPPTVITIAAISNVKVGNMSSNGWIGFTQLQRKWLQHLHDM